MLQLTRDASAYQHRDSLTKAYPDAVSHEPFIASTPARSLKYGPHDSIFLEGDQAGHIYEMVEGAVMLYKLLPDGRRQVVELLVPGDLFGLTCDEFQDCSAEALTVVRVRIHTREAIERSAELQQRLFCHARAQMQALRDHAVLLGRKSAMERVASFIERLALSSDDDAIRLPMTRQEIADYLGLTIETVSRSFSELRRRGLVACERQDVIRVPDLERISELTGAH